MNDSFWPVSGRLQAATASGREPPFVTGSYRLWIQPVDATDWLNRSAFAFNVRGFALGWGKESMAAAFSLSRSVARTVCPVMLIQPSGV
ncbi:hypothetical protein [Pseudomonas lundensis]|uniref:hypothetical protein n=1 Tax=Pseudomonas lundensis TaxID=86185 RepID=UPI000AEE7F93|nr:hypothetical protein [Pseudomonas lundensis]